MPVDTLLVFTAPGCRHCRAACDDLKGRGVRFREIDVAASAEARDQLRGWSWEHRLPVIVDHERVSIGFRGGSSTFAELGIE
jgi:glutaredoxin